MGYNGDSSSSQKKFTIVVISAIVLVGMVGSITYSNMSTKSEEQAVASSNKQSHSICSPTQYKETCEQSIASANSDDPKELINAAFQYAEKSLADVISKSVVIQEAEKDPRTKGALNVCKQVLNTAVEDFKRSAAKVTDFDITKVETYVDDLKTWLSATVTYQETCKDAFKNTTGDAGEKMKTFLKTTSELASNSIAMLSGLTDVLSQLGFTHSTRKLLQNPNDLYIDDPLRRTLLENPNDLYIDNPLKRTLLQNPKDLYIDNPLKRTLLQNPKDLYIDNPLKRTLLQNPKDLYIDNPLKRTLLQNPKDLYIDNPLKRTLLQNPEDLYIDNPLKRTLLQNPEDLYIDNPLKRTLLAQPASLTPNATVSASGSGQFKTINEAIAKVPQGNTSPFIIFITAGVYNENVVIPSKVNNVVLIGEGPTKTKITGSKSYAGGVEVFDTATLAVDGDHFLARDIGIENTAGAEMDEAVALRVSGDEAVFFNCEIDGFRGTLYAHTYRQFYRDCVIKGTVDFVFGDAAAIFQNCKFIIKKPLETQNCIVTAQGRSDPASVGVFVLQKCQISAEPAYLAAKYDTKNYLGRPTKEYSRTIIMNSEIDSSIDPEGWAQWMGTFALDTLYYGEFENKGAGANTAGRVTWKGIQQITPAIAETFTPGKYFKNDFVSGHAIPYAAGMMA